MAENRETQNRYVAYFDMLGFKTATLRDPAQAYVSLSSLRDCMDRILDLDVVVLTKEIILKNRIKAFILADSVLVFTGTNEPYDLCAILTLTSTLFAQALHKCVPLRGAITRGEFFYNIDRNLFGGVPFVKAYELERKAKWSGVIVDDDVAGDYRSWFKDMPKNRDGSSVLVQWDVPVSENEKHSCQCLDWVKPHRDNFTVEPPISVERYYEGFKKLFGEFSQLKPEVQQKYRNTVEFVNSLLQGRSA
jgi:hypothetical protein